MEVQIKSKHQKIVLAQQVLGKRSEALSVHEKVNGWKTVELKSLSLLKNLIVYRR